MTEFFKMTFIQKALVVSLITGGLLSFLGVYVVLRRIIFVSIALSQITACGYAFGFLCGINPTISSILFTLVGMGLFSTQQVEKEIPREAVVGLSYAVASSLAILFIAKTVQAESYVLDFLSGNILTVTDSQLYATLIIFFLAGVLHYLFYKQFMFISFDTETAGTAGVNTKLWNFVFYLILGIVISLSVKTSGIIFTFGDMVIPATTALVIAKNVKNVFFVSVMIGVISSFLGVYLSYTLDLPTGPAIIAVLFLLSSIVWLIKKLL